MLCFIKNNPFVFSSDLPQMLIKCYKNFSKYVLCNKPQFQLSFHNLYILCKPRRHCQRNCLRLFSTQLCKTGLCIPFCLEYKHAVKVLRLREQKLYSAKKLFKMFPSKKLDFRWVHKHHWQRLTPPATSNFVWIAQLAFVFSSTMCLIWSSAKKTNQKHTAVSGRLLVKQVFRYCQSTELFTKICGTLARLLVEYCGVFSILFILDINPLPTGPVCRVFTQTGRCDRASRQRVKYR